MAEGSTPRWVVGLTAILIALAFAVAYHWGASSQKKTSDVPLAQLRTQYDRLNRESTQCEGQRGKYLRHQAKRSGNVSMNEYDQAVERKATIHQKERELNRAVTECLNHLAAATEEHEKAQRSVQSRLEKVTTASKELEVVTDNIQRVRSALGTNRALLFDALLNAKRLNLELLRTMDGYVPVSMEDHEAELIAKYVPSDAPVNLTTVLNAISNNTAPTINATQFLKQMSFKYDPKTHTAVFIPENDGPNVSLNVSRPEWQGRVGNGELTKGVVLKFKNAPVRTTAFQIKSAVALGLCAFRHNNTNLTMPTVYKRSREAEPDQLHLAVETPLLTFCTDCRSAFATPVFKIACFKDFSTNLYGTYEFWSTRSLVRPTPDVIARAREVLATLKIKDASYLAVAFKAPAALKAKCFAMKRAQRHFIWAKATAKAADLPSVEVNAAASYNTKCQPTRDDLIESVKTLLANYTVGAVYVTVDDASVQQELPESINGVKVVSFLPTSALDDVVDMTIASWADRVLLNRFADHSQVVAEAFALRHGLTSSGIHFF